MKRKIASFVLAMVLLCALAVNASATHPVPDLSRNGSLTFVMEFEGVKLDNGKLNISMVGKLAEDDGNYRFDPIKELRKYNISLENDLAEQLLSLAMEVSLPKISASVQDGKAVFADLPVGLYVVWQDNKDATKGLMPIEPFLISVPRLYNGEYTLDVVAKPKNAPQPEPTETTTPPPPTPPTPPNLPQTGQLNWPVPVMALMGAVLFIMGWILCASRKRMENEK